MNSIYYSNGMDVLVHIKLDSTQSTVFEEIILVLEMIQSACLHLKNETKC